MNLGGGRKIRKEEKKKIEKIKNEKERKEEDRREKAEKLKGRLKGALLRHGKENKKLLKEIGSTRVDNGSSSREYRAVRKEIARVQKSMLNKKGRDLNFAKKRENDLIEKLRRIERERDRMKSKEAELKNENRLMRKRLEEDKNALVEDLRRVKSDARREIERAEERVKKKVLSGLIKDDELFAGKAKALEIKMQRSLIDKKVSLERMRSKEKRAFEAHKLAKDNLIKERKDLEDKNRIILQRRVKILDSKMKEVLEHKKQALERLKQREEKALEAHRRAEDSLIKERRAIDLEGRMLSQEQRKIIFAVKLRAKDLMVDYARERDKEYREKVLVLKAEIKKSLQQKKGKFEKIKRYKINRLRKKADKARRENDARYVRKVKELKERLKRDLDKKKEDFEKYRHKRINTLLKREKVISLQKKKAISDIENEKVSLGKELGDVRKAKSKLGNLRYEKDEIEREHERSRKVIERERREMMEEVQKIREASGREVEDLKKSLKEAFDKKKKESEMNLRKRVEFIKGRMQKTLDNREKVFSELKSKRILGFRNKELNLIVRRKEMLVELTNKKKELDDEMGRLKFDKQKIIENSKEKIARDRRMMEERLRDVKKHSGEILKIRAEQNTKVADNKVAEKLHELLVIEEKEKKALDNKKKINKSLLEKKKKLSSEIRRLRARAKQELVLEQKKFDEKLREHERIYDGKIKLEKEKEKALRLKANQLKRELGKVSEVEQKKFDGKTRDHERIYRRKVEDRERVLNEKIREYEKEYGSKLSVEQKKFLDRLKEYREKLADERKEVRSLKIEKGKMSRALFDARNIIAEEIDLRRTQQRTRELIDKQKEFEDENMRIRFNLSQEKRDMEDEIKGIKELEKAEIEGVKVQFNDLLDKHSREDAATLSERIKILSAHAKSELNKMKRRADEELEIRKRKLEKSNKAKVEGEIKRRVETLRKQMKKEYHHELEGEIKRRKHALESHVFAQARKLFG
jgi:hypothetical protein